MGVALVDRARTALRGRSKSSEIENVSSKKPVTIASMNPFSKMFSTGSKAKMMKKLCSAEDVSRKLDLEEQRSVAPASSAATTPTPGSLPALAPAPLPAATKTSQKNSNLTQLEVLIGNPSIDILKRRRAELLAVLLGVIELHPVFLQRYDIVGELGVGAFGFVLVCRQRSTGNEVAVKLISKSAASKSLMVDHELGLVPCEVSSLRRFCHPSIIAYLDSYSDFDYYYLVTELHGSLWGPTLEKKQKFTYHHAGSSQPHFEAPKSKHSQTSSLASASSCPVPLSYLSSRASETTSALPKLFRRRIASLPSVRAWEDKDVPRLRTRKLSDQSAACFQPSSMRRTYTRDLFDCIEWYRRLPEVTALKIFRQLVSAVSYLHSINCVHGDIKDENILVDRSFNIRLIDFGASRPLDQLCRAEDFSGTIHYAAPEVLNGRLYDPGAAEIWTLGILLYTMVTGTTPFSSLDQALQGIYRRPRHVSPECAELIRLCLQPNVEARASIEVVATHRWIVQS